MKNKINLIISALLLTIFSCTLPARSDDSQLLLGVSNYQPSFKYQSLAGMDAIGDSRLQQSISTIQSGSTITSVLSISDGFYQWSMFGALNNITPTMSSSFADGATSSLNLRDRIVLGVVSNYNGQYAPVASVSASGAETVLSVDTSDGGFLGWLTPGTQATPGWVKVTFGAAASVSSSCGTGSGYTPYTVTDSAGDTIPGNCVQDAFGQYSNYGGTTSLNFAIRQTGGGQWANFVVAQPASGTRAQSGDTFTFTTYGPADRAWSFTNIGTGSNVDEEWNINQPALYAALSTPATSVILLDSVNDNSAVYNSPTAGTTYGQCPGPDYPTYTSMINVKPCLSMVDIAVILDGYKNAGKTVFLMDEAPTGRDNQYLESHAIATCTSGASYKIATATQSAAFLMDGSDWAGHQSLAGQTMVAAPLIVSYSGAFYVYSKVTTLTGVNGQYRVDSAGAYYVNATDPACTNAGTNSDTAWLTYAFGSGASSSQQAIMHAWLTDNTSNFTYNAVAYNFPGALFNRPNVISVPLYESLIDASAANYSSSDPNCVSHNCAPLPGAFDNLGLHPSPFGGNLAQAAMTSALAGSKAYTGITDNTQLTKWDNIRCAKSASVTYSYSCTVPASMTATGHPNMVVKYNIGGTIYSATFSGSTVTGTDLTGSISGNTVSLTFSVVPYANTFIDLLEDSTSLLFNGLMDDTSGIGYSGDNVNAPCAGSSGLTYLPAGWTCTLTGYTGLTVTWSMGTNAAGYPAITATITGVATGSGTLKLNNTIVNDANINPSGNSLRLAAQMKVSPYNSHIIGLYPGGAYYNTQCTAFTFPNFYTVGSGLTSFTQISTQTGQDATSTTIPFNDETLAITGQSAGITMNLLSIPENLTGLTCTSGQTMNDQVSWLAGPVNGTITFSQNTFRIRN